MDARNRPLPEWFNRIRTGQVRLPRFQRFEAWGHAEVSSLLEAVLRGLPSGAALILEIGGEEPFVSRTMVGAPTPTERATEHLLDGQQRLTALWRSLHDLYSDRTYLVRLESDVDHPGETLWAVHGQARWEKNGTRYPVWVDDPVELHRRGYIPLALLRPSDMAGIIEVWCDRAASDDLRASREIMKQVNDLRTRVTTYNIPFLALPVSTAKDVALEVFIKMNTSSVRLSAFDIVVAQLEEATGASLHDLIETLTATVPYASAYREPGIWVLDVAALRADQPPTQASYQRLDLRAVRDNWETIVAGIGWAVDFLQEEHVFDAERLPTVAVLPILAALAEYLPTDPDALGRARTVLRSYLWRSFLTRRYEQAAGGRALQDYRGLQAQLSGASGTTLAPILNEADYPLPTVDDLMRAGWPKNKEIVARGILALSLRCGARDLADDVPASRHSVLTREYHHLFPNAVLSGPGGLPPDEVFRALNCALITWRTNRKISARSPLRYLQDRVDAGNLSPGALSDRLASHLIPFDELARAGWDDESDPDVLTSRIRSDYSSFLRARADLLIPQIHRLASGEAPRVS